MKAVLWFLALLALLNAAHASVVISQVLYNPIGTESGGEAVEIRNDGSTAVNISKWVIATGASASDATIPANTVLQPGAVFLVADAGWNSSKDNPAWRNADLEETITMANANSGVALKDSSGNVIDAVGWGNPTGLHEGTPASPVKAGHALVRIKDTDNNAEDFVSAEPDFFPGSGVVVVVNVTGTPRIPLGAVLDSDDSAEPGVQLKPVAGGTRALHLEVFYNGTSASAVWLGKAVSLMKEGGRWKGELLLECWQAPGSHQLIIITESQNLTIPVTILELRAARIETRTVSLQASPGSIASGSIIVKNEGNVPFTPSWQGSDLAFGDKRIPFENFEISNSTILPGRTAKVGVKLRVPENAGFGEYRAIVRMKED
ncbi:MAG: lamin tail domain-containing protein [Candidatus Woesearchaeota archaeon]